jgi:hypothetical protein
VKTAERHQNPRDIAYPTIALPDQGDDHLWCPEIVVGRVPD